MAVRKPSIHFFPAIRARNNRSSIGFLIGKEENRERSPAEPASAEYYCTKLKYVYKQLIVNEIFVKAAGVELFWVLTTRNLLIPGTATTARRAPLPDPLYVYCTKIPFALESDRQTVQSRVHANSALSISMVFTRWRQAQSRLPLDRAHGKSFVLPSRLSLPRALAQD